jgi:prepilin-type processing-associated H-X9-DG protein
MQASVPVGDEGPYDILRYEKASRHSGCVFVAETCLRNFNADAYDLTNASLGNISMHGAASISGIVHHGGLNYLFFDGHVDREKKPPHSMGGELGSFATVDGDKYRITASEDSAFATLYGKLAN